MIQIWNRGSTVNVNLMNLSTSQYHWRARTAKRTIPSSLSNDTTLNDHAGEVVAAAISEVQLPWSILDEIA